MEDTCGDPRYGGAAWLMPELKDKGRRCRNRPTLLHAGDVLPSGDGQRTLHHGGLDGDQSVGQRFGIRESEEPRRSALRPISAGSAKPRAE